MRIIPKAMLNGISPLAVSKAIEVVNILVTYLILPPIIWATPSSAKALLKEAVIASKISQNDSRSIAKLVCSLDAPRVFAKSLISQSTVPKVLLAKLTKIGVIKIDWPKAIPQGVYNNPKKPKGPLLDQSKYSTKPKATVGIPKKALKILRISFFPGKVYNPIITAMGIPHIQAIIVAKPEMDKDLPTIEKTSGSPLIISPKASWTASISVVPINIDHDWIEVKLNIFHFLLLLIV